VTGTRWRKASWRGKYGKYTFDWSIAVAASDFFGVTASTVSEKEGTVNFSFSVQRWRVPAGRQKYARAFEIKLDAGEADGGENTGHQDDGDKTRKD